MVCGFVFSFFSLSALPWVKKMKLGTKASLKH